MRTGDIDVVEPFVVIVSIVFHVLHLIDMIMVQFVTCNRKFVDCGLGVALKSLTC